MIKYVLWLVVLASSCATIDVVNIRRCKDLCADYDARLYKVGKRIVTGTMCCECTNGEYFWLEKREITVDRTF